MTIELSRWSTDAERATLIGALAAPTPPPPASSAPDGAGRGAGRGRGARGRGAAPTAPLSPTARFDAAIKAAPTCGYLWGDVTGYSIRYAWRAPSPDGGDRIVLVTARRLPTVSIQVGAPAPGAGDEGDFTVIEMHLDGKGIGEAKAAPRVVVDSAVNTLALDSRAPAPLLLKVTR